MASFCVIHFQNVDNKDNTRLFTRVSWARVTEFSSAWSQLDGEEREVSLSFQTCVESVHNVYNSGFHRPCYQRFTCKIRLERARKRLSYCNPATLQKHKFPAKCRHMTRGTSVSSLANFPTRSERVLPLVCITCRRHKYEKNKNGAWVKVNLVTCEGDAQKLLELTR